VTEVKNALQPNNARRAVLTPILLSSNHRGSNDFVTSTGMCSSKAQDAMLASPACNALECNGSHGQTALGKQPQTQGPCATSACTDWVLVGWVEGDEKDAVGLNATRHALLPHNPRRCLVRPALLSSNNNSCTHWVMNGLCSTPITSADVLWMEKVAGLAKGSLFKAFTDSRQSDKSATEHPWEPMRRYAAMARVLKEPRGSKSAAHMDELRKSDPLVSLHAWHDWQELHAQVKASWAAQIHQQRLLDHQVKAWSIERASRARAQHSATSATAPRGNTAPTGTGKRDDLPVHASSTNRLKRGLHLGRLQTVDSKRLQTVDSKPGAEWRAERHSSDSVMACLEEEDARLVATPTHKPSIGDGQGSPDSVLSKSVHGAAYEAKGSGPQAAKLPFVYGSWAHVVRPDATQGDVETYSEA